MTKSIFDHIARDDFNVTVDGLCEKIIEQRDRIEALEAALKPFAQNVKAVSLSKALGHITREHLTDARAALDKDASE